MINEESYLIVRDFVNHWNLHYHEAPTGGGVKKTFTLHKRNLTSGRALARHPNPTAHKSKSKSFQVCIETQARIGCGCSRATSEIEIFIYIHIFSSRKCSIIDYFGPLFRSDFANPCRAWVYQTCRFTKTSSNSQIKRPMQGEIIAQHHNHELTHLASLSGGGATDFGPQLYDHI